MKKNLTSLKILLILLIALFLVGLNLSCNGNEGTTDQNQQDQGEEQNQKDTSKQDLTNIDPSSLKTAIDSNYELSKEKVKSWNKKAKLVSVSAKIAPTLDPKDVVEVYSYGANEWANWWWTISVSARSGNYIRAVIPREDYLGSSMKTITLKFWDLNYINAFQIAEQNGGKEWREEQTELVQITCTLAHGAPDNYLYWTVEYQTISGSEKKSVKVNAYTGEVTTESE